MARIELGQNRHKSQCLKSRDFDGNGRNDRGCRRYVISVAHRFQADFVWERISRSCLLDGAVNKKLGRGKHAIGAKTRGIEKLNN